MWEYKFVFKDDRIAEPTFEVIGKMTDFAGYDCRFSKLVENEDYYFDTNDLRLDSLGMVCRLRQTKEEDSERFCFTIKRP